MEGDTFLTSGGTLMSDEQKKKLFFYLFEIVLNNSYYDDPYDLLLVLIDPLFECIDCPLKHKQCSVNYEGKNCVRALEDALKKGDIQL